MNSFTHISYFFNSTRLKGKLSVKNFFFHKFQKKNLKCNGKIDQLPIHCGTGGDVKDLIVSLAGNGG